MCLRKIGIAMGGRHNFPRSKHLISCVLANSANEAFQFVAAVT